jgi:hypothetical protein
MVLWMTLQRRSTRASLPLMSRFEDEMRLARTPRPRQELRDRGVSRRAIAGGSYERSSRGYHRRTAISSSVSSADPPTSTQRILDATAVLPPGALLGGWAAAYVHGVDTIDGRDHLTLAPLPVPILLPPGSRRRSTPALSYRQSARPPRGEMLHELPVTTLWRTVFDLARWAPDVTEAVVAVDAVLASRLVTRQGLDRSIATAPSRRGIAQVRTAVTLSRAGVGSPWESRLRMFATFELRMVTLQPNRAVFDRGGQLLGIPDLLDVDAGLAIEYDGAGWRAERSHGHRDRRQHREDNIREERLERAGLVVVRVDKADLIEHRTELASRLRAAHTEGTARDRRRDAWTLDEPEGWYGLPA